LTDVATRVRTPLFPPYSQVRQLLTIWEGVPKASVMSMRNAISDQTGTPQQPVDWSDPDAWIDERLSGDEEKLARRIWEESNRTVNPRHIAGAYLFINGHDLLVSDATGVYGLTDRGQAFQEGDEEVVREIDDAEGLPQLLAILATKTRAKRGDLLPEWEEFLHEYSKFGTPSTIRDTLRRRLANLIERGFVSREGNVYVIEQKGIDYAASSGKVEDDRRRQVLDAMKAYNDDQRELLREQLSTMHPYAFEQLVRDLLEAMGYEDVTVTKQSGDKGVDVVATVQFGITTVTEVVQVKRQKGSIGRPVLDQLRGALPYHKAIRGTLRTLGNFSKGCTEAALFPGAAPVGLINGKKLLELLVEHGIGIQKRPATLYELDESYFEASTEEELEEDVLGSGIVG
jgi:restriction system protein